MTLERWRKKKVRSDAACQCLAWTQFMFCAGLHFLIQQWTFATHHLSHTALSHTTFHSQLSHTRSFTHHLWHIHHFLRRTPSFTYHFVTHNSSHTTCFTSRPSTTSFVFPSFPVLATTLVAHYWKKLTCGAVRSFNLTFFWAFFLAFYLAFYPAWFSGLAGSWLLKTGQQVGNYVMARKVASESSEWLIHWWGCGRGSACVSPGCLVKI